MDAGVHAVLAESWETLFTVPRLNTAIKVSTDRGDIGAIILSINTRNGLRFVLYGAYDGLGENPTEFFIVWNPRTDSTTDKLIGMKRVVRLDEKFFTRNAFNEERHKQADAQTTIEAMLSRFFGSSREITLLKHLIENAERMGFHSQFMLMRKE